ncbi:hypothetical protein FRB99_000133 [Tulasnella sp. 403]|nr:hypothetical protein FRB99_000133 [Tulasnella sp. 403]
MNLTLRPTANANMDPYHRPPSPMFVPYRVPGTHLYRPKNVDNSGRASPPPRIDIPSYGPPLRTTITTRPVTANSMTDDESPPGLYRQAHAASLAHSDSSTPPSTASSHNSSIRSLGRFPIPPIPPSVNHVLRAPAPLEWDNVFHPSFIAMPNFEAEWHFTGLYTSHILFSQNVKLPPSRKLLVYNIDAQTAQVTKVRYDTAGLGPDGKWLLYRERDEMYLYDVISARTVKNASLRNLRRWTYNDLGFCIVDESGKFWRWHFNDKLPPALVFRLVDRAPRDSLRCLTTRDGTWNAIVATDRDRKRGEVHCYPTDNDEARIFPGILAAFMQAEMDGATVTYVVVVNVESESELSFSINQLGSPCPGAVKRVETRMPFEVVGGPASAMFIDHDLAVAVILVTPPNETYIALLFDLRSGTFLTKQTVTKYPDDSWLVDDTGIFRERRGSIVQRLRILPEALPPRLAGSRSPMSTMAPMPVPRLSPVSSGQQLGYMYSPHSPSRQGSLPPFASSPPNELRGIHS